MDKDRIKAPPKSQRRDQETAGKVTGNRQTERRPGGKNRGARCSAM